MAVQARGRGGMGAACCGTRKWDAQVGHGDGSGACGAAAGKALTLSEALKAESRLERVGGAAGRVQPAQHPHLRTQAWGGLVYMHMYAWTRTWK